MVLFAISCFACTLPHFIFGDQLLHANDAFYGTVSVSAIHNSTTNTTERTDSLNLCTFNSKGNNVSGSGKIFSVS